MVLRHVVVQIVRGAPLVLKAENRTSSMASCPNLWTCFYRWVLSAWLSPDSEGKKEKQKALSGGVSGTRKVSRLGLQTLRLRRQVCWTRIRTDQTELFHAPSPWTPLGRRVALCRLHLGSGLRDFVRHIILSGVWTLGRLGHHQDCESFWDVFLNSPWSRRMELTRATWVAPALVRMEPPGLLISAPVRCGAVETRPAPKSPAFRERPLCERKGSCVTSLLHSSHGTSWKAAHGNFA